MMVSSGVSASFNDSLASLRMLGLPTVLASPSLLPAAAVQNDASKIKSWMDTFNETGQFVAPTELISVARSEMKSTTSSQEMIKATIANVYQNHGGAIIDPHTAVGVSASSQVWSSRLTIVTACTAQAAPSAQRLCAGRQTSTCMSTVLHSITQ